METDLNDYTVIKEGEAEILMHKKNQVFFNKAQVSKFLFFMNIFLLFLKFEAEIYYHQLVVLFHCIGCFDL